MCSSNWDSKGNANWEVSFRQSWIQGVLLPSLFLGLVSFADFIPRSSSLHVTAKMDTGISEHSVITASSPRRESHLSLPCCPNPLVHFSNLMVDSSRLTPWANHCRPEPFFASWLAVPGPHDHLCSPQEPPGIGRGSFPVKTNEVLDKGKHPQQRLLCEAC